MKKEINKIAKNLERWWILVHWTDTCFWFATFFDNKIWIKNIQKIKWRTVNKPFSLVFSSIDEAKKYVQINSKQEDFIKKHRIQTSFILNKKEILKDYFPDFKNVSIRIENDNFLFKPVSAFWKPLTSTSVNISWEKNLNTKKEILNIFWKYDFIDFIFSEKNKINWSASIIWNLAWEDAKRLR